MVAKFTGKMKDTDISIQENQMFLVFHTNREIVRKGFHALIIESKCLSESRNCIISFNALTCKNLKKCISISKGQKKFFGGK